MRKLEAAALLVLIPMMLAGCAHPQLIDLGAAESQVIQKLSSPERHLIFDTVVLFSTDFSIR